MPIPAFDHLILLVGTNPLPNYITTEYLLQENQTNTKSPVVHLIHSYQTEEIAEQLERKIHDLPNFANISFEFIKLNDPYNPYKVRQTIDNALGKMKGNVHLNHTGGTKSMAVECALLATDTFSQNLTRSYLNPRTFRLDIADGSYPSNGSLCDIFKHPFELLINLHNCNVLQTANFNHPVAASCMLNAMINDDTHFHEWRKNWLASRKTLLDISNQEKKSTRQIKAAQDLQSDYEIGWDWSKWGQTMQDVLEKLLKMQVATDPAKVYIKFLAGGWLEELIASKMKEHGYWNKIVENTEVIHRGAKDRRKMELDVVGLHGYSLSLFSCTTSNSEKEIKLKCFEAIHRAQQIGGEEAKAVMVCTAEKSICEDLAKDLEIDHGGRPPLKFISKNGLKTLNKSIHSIATSQADSSGQEIIVF